MLKLLWFAKASYGRGCVGTEMISMAKCKTEVSPLDILQFCTKQSIYSQLQGGVTSVAMGRNHSTWNTIMVCTVRVNATGLNSYLNWLSGLCIYYNPKRDWQRLVGYRINRSTEGLGGSLIYYLSCPRHGWLVIHVIHAMVFDND